MSTPLDPVTDARQSAMGAVHLVRVRSCEDCQFTFMDLKQHTYGIRLLNASISLCIFDWTNYRDCLGVIAGHDI